MSVVQQLHDIHIPPSIKMWPLAIGWWLLIIGSFCFVGIFGFAIFYLKHFRIKKTLLDACKNIQQQYEFDHNAAKALNALSILLKRAALQYYPRDQVAGLHGEEWLKFLSNTSKKIDVYKTQELFEKMVYQKNIEVDISQAFEMVKKWIEQQRKPCMN